MAMCIKAQCPHAATAGLAIDSPSAEVWIIDWPKDAVLLSPMCSYHADRLTIPGGWLLHDNRVNTSPALFADRSVARAKSTAKAPGLDNRAEKREMVAETPELFDETVGTDPVVADSDADETSPTSFNKSKYHRELIGEPEDRHSEMLDVDDSTPLLERAFRSSQST